MSKDKKKRSHRLDVDEIMRAVDRFEGKVLPEDHARLRAVAELLFAIREELRADDASMDRLRFLVRGVRGVPT